jgi:hypothetical protein
MHAVVASKSPAGRILDVTLFAPLGLALTVAEAFPGLARKGRSRVEGQVGTARAVGQLAVQQGYHKLRRLATSGPPFFRPGQPSPTPSGTGATAPITGLGADRRAAAKVHAAERVASASQTGRQPGAQAGGHPGASRARPGQVRPEAPELAIPSYDSLSASQVVQRLAGLSREEVEAVRAYEAGTRARRTVLLRADQLLA